MLTADYVVGLVDGEGSFSVHLNRSHRRRAKVEPRFCLKLRAVDRPILDALRDFFGCGKVYVQRDSRPNHCLCYRFEVSNRLELREKIIPFFDQHPPRFPSKQYDFALFRCVIELIGRDAHLTTDGLERIEQLASRMHLGSLDALDTLVQWERGEEFNRPQSPPVKPRKCGASEVAEPTARGQAPTTNCVIGTKS
jgi:hypothetical protein